jgi:hypothetical protein
VSMTYLGSRTLIVLNIASRLWLDSCLFLLEVIRVSNSSSLHFQAHSRLSQEFFLLVATPCLPHLNNLPKREKIDFK